MAMRLRGGLGCSESWISFGSKILVLMRFGKNESETKLMSTVAETTVLLCSLAHLNPV